MTIHTYSLKHHTRWHPRLFSQHNSRYCLLRTYKLTYFPGSRVRNMLELGDYHEIMSTDSGVLYIKFKLLIEISVSVKLKIKIETFLTCILQFEKYGKAF